MNQNTIMPDEYKLDLEPFHLLTANEYELVEFQSDDSEIKNAQVVRISIKDQSAYINLNKGYLEVQVRLVKAANQTAYAADDQITLCNNVMSLFSRCILRVQNQVVESVEQAHIVAAVKSLLHYSNDYADTASNVLYYKDTGVRNATDECLGGEDENVRLLNNALQAAGNDIGENTALFKENLQYNAGFVQRQRITGASNIVSCYVPLSHIFSFCQVDRIMVSNQVSLEFTKSPATEHIIRSSAVADGLVHLQRMSCWIPRILPKPEVEMSLKAALGSGVLSKYKYNTFNAYVSDNVANAAATATFRVITQSEKPLRCFIYLRRADLTQANPKLLTEDQLSTLSVRLNGKTYPGRDFTDLQGVGKSRAYMSLLEYMNKNRDYSTGNQLTRQDWDRTSIFSVDLSNVPENWSKSPSTIEIISSFNAARQSGGAAVPRQIVCVVMSEKEATINYSGSQPVVVVN